MSNNDKLKSLQPATQTRRTLTSTATVAGGGPATVAVTRPMPDSSMLAQRVAGMEQAEKDKAPAHHCQQCVYMSIFFDGTGNNLKADSPTSEHSNVARLYRAAIQDPSKGMFTRYVPGIGTLFPEIGDDGKGPIPLVDHHNGMGAVGQQRLDWTFKELGKVVREAEQRALNPTNKILHIKLAIFGFSRGSTLARAFVRDLVSPKLGKSEIRGANLTWKAGGYPLSVEFLGIFDTVASVGLPMSANNAKDLRSSRRGKAGNAARIGAAVVLPALGVRALRAQDLAFGPPGADPAPGSADGHAAWADDLVIPPYPMVKRCVHFVAAHEIRNSFPVDSVRRGAHQGANCVEMAYPGSHSDVGGGYRPGEGGKGGPATPPHKSPDGNGMVLSRIPLRAMYQEAIAVGVPLVPMGSEDWSQANASDFSIAPELVDRFNSYMSEAGWGGAPLGTVMLAHMRLFFAWRWYRIIRGRTQEFARIRQNEVQFARDRAALKREIADLESRRDTARRQASVAQAKRDAMLSAQRYNPKSDPDLSAAQRAAYDQEIAAARTDEQQLTARIKETQSRIDAAANDTELPANLSTYDAELVHDVSNIIGEINDDSSLKSRLRPHYKNLFETYDDELKNKGLRDQSIIDFFDVHVHDSLAGFAKDSTLPSDPRVVYLGGDLKYFYAQNESANETAGAPA